MVVGFRHGSRHPVTAGGVFIRRECPRADIGWIEIPPCSGIRPHRDVLWGRTGEGAAALRLLCAACLRLWGNAGRNMAGTKMRGSAALHGNEVQANRKAGPQAVFR